RRGEAGGGGGFTAGKFIAFGRGTVVVAGGDARHPSLLSKNRATASSPQGSRTGVARAYGGGGVPRSRGGERALLARARRGGCGTLSGSRISEVRGGGGARGG